MADYPFKTQLKSQTFWIYLPNTNLAKKNYVYIKYKQ